VILGQEEEDMREGRDIYLKGVGKWERSVVLIKQKGISVAL
jgi:hypothetical protein